MKISQAALEVVHQVLQKHILQQQQQPLAGSGSALHRVVCEFLLSNLYERLGDTRESIRNLAVEILATSIPLANLLTPSALTQKLLFLSTSATTSTQSKQQQQQPPLQHKNWRVRQQVSGEEQDKSLLLLFFIYHRSSDIFFCMCMLHKRRYALHFVFYL